MTYARAGDEWRHSGWAHHLVLTIEAWGGLGVGQHRGHGSFIGLVRFKGHQRLL
jgi:hypothetical protein